MNKRLVLLDRDGVLNVDTGYVHTAAQWQWIPGAPEAIAYLSECGCRIAVVTNQSGIARGMYTEGQVQELQRFVNHQLAMTGGQIDFIIARICRRRRLRSMIVCASAVNRPPE